MEKKDPWNLQHKFEFIAGIQKSTQYKLYWQIPKSIYAHIDY